MATGNTAARNERASDFAADFTAATLTIKDGVTTLAVHTLAGFGAPATGVITANAIADATIGADGTADTVELTATGKTYDLEIGTDVTLSTTNFITGETSSVTSLVVTFPA